jgi:hypothetical protein
MRQDIVSLPEVYHVTTNFLLMVTFGVEALTSINSFLNLAVIVLQKMRCSLEWTYLR